MSQTVEFKVFSSLSDGSALKLFQETLLAQAAYANLTAALSLSGEARTNQIIDDLGIPGTVYLIAVFGDANGGWGECDARHWP